MRWLWAGAVCALVAVAQPAQQDEVRVSAHVYTPPQARLTAQVQLVQLEVVVRDPRGHAVGGLKQGDFEILDEGKPRAIAAFSVEARESASTAPSPAIPPSGALPPVSPAQAPPRSR
jgi:hypothetical protein